MKAIVELLAFGQPGEVREVTVPLDLPPTLANIFHFGQNDFQPQDHPSVSAGDVIHINEDERWLVLAAGFKRLNRSNTMIMSSYPRKNDHCTPTNSHYSNDRYP